jgi:hypothetical protein
VTVGGDRIDPDFVARKSARQRREQADATNPVLEQFRALRSSPPARPTPAAYAPGQIPVPSAASIANEALRQRAQAAVAFHIGGKIPGIELNGATRPIADRFLELTGNDPGMVAALEADVNALFALTDTEIADRIARGEPLGQFGDIFDAIAEISWQVGADEVAARALAEAQDGMSGTFDALTAVEAQQLALAGVGPGTVTPGARFMPDQGKAQSFATLFDVPGAWSYSPSARLLAVTVGEQTVGIRTSADFDPTTHLDVMAEVVAAQSDGRIAAGGLTGGQAPGVVAVLLDKAHEIGHFLDSHPTLRNNIDMVWEAAAQSFAGGDPGAHVRRWQGDYAGPLERASDRLRDEKGNITNESVRLASAMPLPDDGIIAVLARTIMEEAAGVEAQDALALAAETVAENREQLRDEFSQLTQEQLLEELQADVEGESALGEAIGGGIDQVLNKLEWWDLFTQQIGLNAIDFYRDIGEGVAALAEGSRDEAFEKFDAAFTEPIEHGTTAGDYFGLTGGAADTANLLVGGIFDPTNYFLLGGKGLQALVRRAMVNPKFAPVLLKMGRFPQVAKQIADGVGARGVMSVVGSSVGLDDIDYVDLVKIALDPEGTVDQVNKVWARAMTKDWIPNTTLGPVRHSTVEGVGRMLDAAVGGHLSPEHLDDVFKYFAKNTVGRTFRLGENQAMSNFGDLVIQFFPADPERAGNLIIRAAEARLAAGDDLALAGASATMKEQARRTIRETSGPIRQMLDAADPRAVNQNLRAVEDALTHLPSQGLDEATEAALRTQLNQMHRIMARRVDDAGPRLAAHVEKKALANKVLKKATALEGDMAANAARNVMADQVYRLYDEVAVEINKQFGSDVIPVIRGKVNPLAPDVPVRDWTAVNGIKSRIAHDDPDLALMMGLSVDDAEMAKAADAVGMFNRSQKMLLPASPYEVILYQKLGGNETLYRKAMGVLRSEHVKWWTRKVKFLFAANLLINPLTAGKITLDETLRFLADTGNLPAFLRATAAGLPLGAGKVSEGVVRSLKHWRGGGTSVVSPWSLQYSRNVGGWSADDFADYGWVVRPPRRVGIGQMNRNQYIEQVERWVNGSLLNDRRFREYARWLDEAVEQADGTLIPPTGWTEWWEKGGPTTRPGKSDARMVTVTVRDTSMLGTELTASDAFNIVHQIFENWIDLLVDDPVRNQMRRTLLAAARGARGPLDLVADARLLKSVSQVPGISGKTNFGSQIFNVFFGAPSGRRAGVFYEHYFDEAFDMLKARHGDRVLTVEKVMDFTGADRQTAEFWLKQGSENAAIAQMVRDTGMRTEAQLAARAAAYAERRADDLMYRFTASSLVGRGVESGLLFPFARAQADFLSWWSDHMFRPLTLNLSLEQRARLGPLMSRMVEGVERLPLNLRAWAKYAHLVSAVNNDQPSVVDQLIDNLTFFPVHGGTEFLIDVVPQFGPVPSWMFDVMVDRGLISDALNANFEALFPALGYTELESDWGEDLFNRLLPNSRRSLRDLTVGMLRGGYALIGKDIHTNPGFMGTVANILAENKVPAATGDFQVALVADELKDHVWDLVPGSEEWQTRFRDIAIEGARQANVEEGWQDMKDRLSPLTGYDAEYRSLRSYEGLFEEERFQTMSRLGLFSTADLLDEDGVPRIKAAWDRYLAGESPDAELRWLDDRLTTIYFDAGRLEILPGFSYLDYLHLSNPELAVNLIAKNEDSGIPVRSEDHAEFKTQYINKLTGRLQNVPPGPEGAELVAEARRRGWLVSRPMEEWAQDAAEAIYKSGQRAVHGVWEAVSGRTWQAGLTKGISNQTFTLQTREAMILKAAGVEASAGQDFTYREFFDLIDSFDERFDVAQPVLINTLERGAVHGQLARHNDAFGQGLLDALHQAELDANKLGIPSIEDWPEDVKETVRERFREAINLGYTTVADYAQEIEPIFGPLDYEPPVPPPVDELTQGLLVTDKDLENVAVIDGDTISVMLEDGPMRVRLIGINAPEATQDGYQEARGNLEALVAQADEIVFGLYKPELFGTTQLTAPGEHRLLAWLYVDGVPIYDASVFTVENPRGAGVGGTVLDLEAIYQAGKK